MKYFLTLLVLLGYSLTYSQKYQPLVEEGKYWVYRHISHSDCFLMSNTPTEIRFFEGDTIFNDHLYKKLVSSFVPNNVLPYKITSKQILCYMREDTLQKKVFIINDDEYLFPCIDNNEICIWDFGLKVGDTIKNCTYNMFYSVGISETNHNVIDSIINGRFFTFGYNPGQCNDPRLSVVSYVEGFGMEDGPIYRHFGTSLIEFCEGTLEQCNIISSLQEYDNYNKNDVLIFPNPVKDDLVIKTNLEILRIDVFNSNGKLVLTGTDREVNTSSLLTGIYFIKLISKQNKQYFRKFVKM